MEAALEQGSMYMWIDANQARILIGNSAERFNDIRAQVWTKPVHNDFKLLFLSYVMFVNAQCFTQQVLKRIF